MSKTSLKLNYKGVGNYMKNSPDVDKVLKDTATKKMPEFKKRSERAERQMKEIFPGYKVVSPKNFTVSKGEKTDRMKYLITNEKITPADWLFNPYVGG